MRTTWMAVGSLLVLLAGCQQPAVEAPAPTITTPSPGSAASGGEEAAVDPQIARDLALAEHLALAADVADLAEVIEARVPCEGGVAFTYGFRPRAVDPAAMTALVDAYADRWADAGWTVEVTDDEADRTVTTTTDEGLALRWAAAADDQQSVGTLTAALPCTDPADLPAAPSLSAVISRLEPDAIRVVEALTGPDAWTADTAEEPCGDPGTRSTLTLQGPTALPPEEALATAAQVAGDGVRIAAGTLLVDRGDGQVLVLSAREGEVALRAHGPCTAG